MSIKNRLAPERKVAHAGGHPPRNVTRAGGSMPGISVSVLAFGLALALMLGACSGAEDRTADAGPDVLNQVTQALLVKHNLNPGSLEVTLNRVVDDKYASGGARDVPGPGSGTWFAALADGEWRIVWDGNGNIDCPSLAPYPDFPASMISACYNPSDGSVTRR